MNKKTPTIHYRRLGAAVLAASAAGAFVLAAPAYAAGGPVTKISITPSTVTATSGQCVTFTVTEQAADGSTATSGQFTPTVTLGGNTIATYGTPTAGAGGVVPACTDSTVSPSGATGSVFTFGVSTVALGNAATTITAANATGTITSSATETVGTAASTAPTAISLDFGAPTNLGVAELCPTTTTDPMTTTGMTQQVCAKVTANGGLTGVAAQPVTFTVSSGTVADTATDATAAGATKTVQVQSDANGVATAFVSSATAATQTITAGTGALTSTSLTDTYEQGTSTGAATLTLTPMTATIASEGSMKFTATVTDTTSTPVSGVTVTFTQSGDGNIDGTTTETVSTGSTGTASVTVSAPSDSTAAGAGTLTASAPTPAGMTSTSTATSTYTISAAKTTPKTVKTKLYQHSMVKGQVEQTAVLSPAAAHTKVNFFVVVNGKRKYVGHATTNSAGKASHKIYHLKPGTTYKAQARAVGLPKGTTSTFSAVNSQKVK